VTDLEAPSILGIDYLRRGYFKDQKGYWWAFSVTALNTEKIKQLFSLPGLSEDLSVGWGCCGLKNSKCQLLP